MSIGRSFTDALFRAFLPRSRRGRQARLKRLNDTGVSMYIQGRYEESEREFLKMIRTSQETGAQPHLHASVLKQVGDFYHNNGHYSKAEPLYKKSLELKKSYYPSGHDEILASLNDLALLHYLQGRYEDAEPIYQRLLGLLEQHLGAGHREVAVCLENYAALLRKLHRDSESDELKARARSIRKEFKG